MSIIKNFLNKSVIIAGIVSISMISIPVTNVSAKVNSRVIGNHNNVVINNNSNRGRGYRGGQRRGHRGGNGAGLVAGLIGGAILFSALNSSSRYDNHHYSRSRVDIRYGYNSGYRQPYYRYNAPYRYRGPRTRVVYVDRPVQTVIREVPVYSQPQPAYNYQPVTAQQQQPQQNNSCLQSREYTTTIQVGGQSVPAYGQACLQPDGSWKFGDPVATPSF